MQAMPALFTTELNPRHERFLAVVLILLALAAIGGTLWRYLPGWFGPGPLAAAGTGGPADFDRQQRPARSLADYGLFGAAPDGAGEGPALPISAPTTSLDLELHGTLATRDPDKALAIVADPEGREHTYAVGAELPGGAVLHRVYPDRAILRRAGQLETLPLRDPERATAASGERAVSGNARSTGNGSRDGGGTGELARAAERLRDNPAALARQFTAVPVQEGGQMVGVRLRTTDGSALLSRVGLRASDVVTAVNGVPVNDFSRTGEIMTQLQSGNEFQVTVLRNGQEQQINVTLSD